jgi:hypothetical protein
MQGKHQVFILDKKAEEKVVKLIFKIYENVPLKCKALKEKFDKKFAKFLDQKLSIMLKSQLTKEYKIFKVKSDELTFDFRASEVYKQYHKSFNELGNLQLVDKKLVREYNKAKVSHNTEISVITKALKKTGAHLKFQKMVRKRKAMLVKTKEARALSRCAFDSFGEEYIVIIKLLLQHLKGDKRNAKIYSSLKKINLKQLTYTQYKKVTAVFNKVVIMPIFHYV